MSRTLSSSDSLEPWNDLTGKVVMVTGASSGIGRDFCLNLYKTGCKIIAAARRIDRLEALCDQINSSLSSDGISEVRAVAVAIDISSDSQSIEASVNKAWDSFGRIDALINNAGFRGNIHTPLNLSEEEWNDIVRPNLTGSWSVSKYVCARMRDTNLRGSIINVSSISGLRNDVPGGVAYATAKNAINTITKVMALELGTYNIRVNSICPGLFKSEITEGLMKKKWLNTVLFRMVPLRTVGTSDPALTSVARYLIHDSSEYVSGNIFIVDAGTTLPGVPLFSSL